MSEQNRGETLVRVHRKIQWGYAVSDKMDKTVIVEVEDRRERSLYGKVITCARRVKAYDENNEMHVGNPVRIMETRLLSTIKHFHMVKTIEKTK